MTARKLATFALTASAIVFVGCQKKADLKKDEAKFSYAVGHQIGRNMKSQGADIDVVAFSEAVADVMADKKPKMTEEEMREAMKAAAENRRNKDKKDAEANKAKGEKFLAENKGKEGVKITASGLQYKVVSDGSGKMPKADDVVEVHYKGSLIDGTEFDSSYKRNKPAQFPVKAVIPGWTEALQMMKVGSKYQLFIPSALGYGERGNPRIPGNSVLIFDVELISIKDDAKKK